MGWGIASVHENEDPNDPDTPVHRYDVWVTETPPDSGYPGGSGPE